MAWARIEDGFYDNPKILRVSLAAVGLHASLIAYCNRHLTDGHVTKDVTRLLSRNNEELVTELVTGLLLDVNGDGYSIHDYLDYQPSKKSILDRRAKNTQKVTSWRERNQVGNQVRNQVGNPAPIPSHPLPSQPKNTGTTTTRIREGVGISRRRGRRGGKP